jgi:hypothetical protein
LLNQATVGSEWQSSTPKNLLYKNRVKKITQLIPITDYMLFGRLVEILHVSVLLHVMHGDQVKVLT